MEELRALFIGAHSDECEYGTGGLAYLLRQNGVRTRFYNTCVFYDSDTTEQAEREKRISEEAAAMLGAEKRIEGGSVPVWCRSEAHVNHILQEILSFQPHLVFLHYPKDTHIEHRETAKASYAALCMAPAYGWHCSEVYAFEAGPDQTVQYMTPDIVIDITDVVPVLDVCYHHFGRALGDQLTQEKQTGAAFRGLKSNYAYGEAYKIIKFPDHGGDLILRQMLKERFSWFGNEYYPAYGELYF
ncbi:MAG: hypothetical protein J5602_14385 [Clostridia bacterium]|nr:hypothetical protein [Clostridia bacterium]